MPVIVFYFPPVSEPKREGLVKTMTPPKEMLRLRILQKVMGSFNRQRAMNGERSGAVKERMTAVA